MAVIGMALALASCGGGGYGGSAGSPPPPPPPPPPPVVLDVSVAGMAVTKVRTHSLGVTVMEEELAPLATPVPRRRITLLDANGALVGRYVAPPDWSVIDFAQHPSGDVTVAIATAKSVKLVRVDHLAVVRSELALVDAQAPSDPFYDDGGIRDDNSLLPVYTRDAVRVAAIGENVAVALRTGRNAVVAYRFDFGAADGFARRWRTLVEPGLSLFAIGITSGTYDVFGQLENHWHVQVDADTAGNIAVAAASKPFSAPLFAAHADYFRQPISAAAGVLVTRLAPDGQRQGTTVIDTAQVSELHGLRLMGDDVAVVGRVFSERRDDGGGWNAYVAHVDRASGSLLGYRLVDVDRGEILFDIAPLALGRYVAVGAAGYTQNPDGASISEQATPLLVVLESDGTVRQRLSVTAGPRQNQLRSLAPWAGNWLVAGLQNAPGTHSGDANPALITADGFVRAMTIQP